MKKRSIFVMLTTILVLMFGMASNAAENPQFGVLNESAPLLEQIYNSVSAGDFTVLQQIDGSNAADALATEVLSMGLENYYCIFDGTTDTGKGAGIYAFNDGSYYFYCGDYVNGIRQGTGTYCCDYDDDAIDPTNVHYYSYTGEWANDKPNGQGNIRFTWNVDNPEYRYITLTKGTYKDGLENGDMERYYFDGYDYNYYVWHSTMGVPTRTYITLSGNDKPINVLTTDGVPTVGYVSSKTLPANGSEALSYDDAGFVYGMDPNTIFALQYVSYDISEDGTQYFPYSYGLWQTLDSPLGVDSFCY